MKQHFLRHILCYLLFFLSVPTLPAQTLSEQAQISLLTYAPGTELYAAFGHSALRVQDPALSLDKVYNYGMFSFDEPGFYLKFMQGKLRYWLGAYDFRYLQQEQQARDISIQEQVMRLNLQEKQAVFDFLNNNLQPAHRFYFYDFFFDNCATRIRDVFENVLGDRLQSDTTFAATPVTFRNLIGEYLIRHPWAGFGIDLALGSDIDRPATAREYLFLPDYLAAVLQKSLLQQDGQALPLVQEKHLLFKGDPAPDNPPFYQQPQWICATIVLAFLVWTFFTRHQSITYWPDIVWLSLYGLTGLLLFMLWFATDHQATKANYNLLWMHPLHLITVFLLIQKRKGLFTKIFLLLNGFAALLLLACWEIIPQTLHPACLPLVTLLGFRYFYQASAITLAPLQTTRKRLVTQP